MARGRGDGFTLRFAALLKFTALPARECAFAQALGHELGHFGIDLAGLLHADLSSQGMFISGKRARIAPVVLVFLFLLIF